MDKRYAIVGGLFLIGGAAAFWYLSQQNGNGKPCNYYTNQLACEAAGCYWYSGGCHSYPPNGEACTHLLPGDSPGYGYPNGWRTCDPIDGDLCQWDDIGKKWFLIEENSPDCDTEHKKCYVSSSTGYPTCGLWPGEETDECGSYAKGCPCAPGSICQPNTWCETRDYICRLTALNTTITATSANMNCFDQGGASYCNYWLNEPLAANSISGDLYYKWGPWPAEWADWGIFAYYKGHWRALLERTDWIVGPTGKITVPLTTFETQGIEMLQFGIDALVSNIHIDKFIGHINY